jgi:hypothetical protein
MHLATWVLQRISNKNGFIYAAIHPHLVTCRVPMFPPGCPRREWIGSADILASDHPSQVSGGKTGVDMTGSVSFESETDLSGFFQLLKDKYPVEELGQQVTTNKMCQTHRINESRYDAPTITSTFNQEACEM